jgi:hypothetical protein
MKPEFEATREDIKLFNHAVRERWPIPDRVRQKMMAKLEEALEKERTFIQASSILARLDQINVDATKRPPEGDLHLHGDLQMYAAIFKSMSQQELADFMVKMEQARQKHGLSEVQATPLENDTGDKNTSTEDEPGALEGATLVDPLTGEVHKAVRDDDMKRNTTQT